MKRTIFNLLFQITFQPLSIRRKNSVSGSLLLLLLIMPAVAFSGGPKAIRRADVIIYGGTSAAETAAVLSIDNKVSPQQLPYEKLKAALLRDKQELTL